MNRYIFALLMVALSWGLTFPAIKQASLILNGLEVTALRFLLCSIVLIPFALKIPKQVWKDGFILAVLGVVSYSFQAWGMRYITASRSSVITNLSIVFMPFFMFLTKKHVGRSKWIASALAFFGVALMSWGDGGNWKGDALTLVTAVVYTLWVAKLSESSRRNNTWHLTVAQIICTALLAYAVLMIQGDLPSDIHVISQMNKEEWISILYLGLIASGAMLFIQAWSQRKVDSVRAAMIYGTEPMFAVIFSWLLLGEVIGPMAIVGVLAVVAALIIGVR